MTTTLSVPARPELRCAGEPIGHTFRAIGTINAVLVTRDEVLDEAVGLAQRHLTDLDRAASRFRADSEVSRLAARSVIAADEGRSGAAILGSPLFLDYLAAARHAARISDGLVDFTVGSALVAAGYDADLDVIRARHGHRADLAGDPRSTASAEPRVPGWLSVHVDPATGRVETPAGTVIDLGASAKAHAADTIARLLAQRLPGGFLVNLGGDIATSGDLPDGGWRVGVEAADGTVRQVVALTGQALTTSSTQLRTWATAHGQAHHIIDPRTGAVAPVVWAHVSCVGATALEANTASTAALVLGEDAPAWLTRHGLSARLERAERPESPGSDEAPTLLNVVTTPGWPASC